MDTLVERSKVVNTPPVRVWLNGSMTGRIEANDAIEATRQLAAVAAHYQARGYEITNVVLDRLGKIAYADEPGPHYSFGFTLTVTRKDELADPIPAPLDDGAADWDDVPW